MAVYQTVVAGTTITASWGNNVRDGLINSFASAAARNSAVSSPPDGFVSYLQDSPKRFEYYDASTGTSRPLVAYRDRVTLSSSSASLQIIIPSTVREAVFCWHARGDTAAEAVNVILTVNNDTTATLYHGHYTSVQGSSAPITTQINGGNAGVLVGVATAASAGAPYFGGGTISVQGLGTSVEVPNIEFESQMWSSASQSFYLNGGSMYNGGGPFTTWTLKPATGNFASGSWISVLARD